MEDLREWIFESMNRHRGIPRSTAIHHYCVNPHPSREVSTNPRPHRGPLATSRLPLRFTVSVIRTVRCACWWACGESEQAVALTHTHVRARSRRRRRSRRLPRCCELSSLLSAQLVARSRGLHISRHPDFHQGETNTR